MDISLRISTVHAFSPSSVLKEPSPVDRADPDRAAIVVAHRHAECSIIKDAIATLLLNDGPGFSVNLVRAGDGIWIAARLV